MGGKKKSWHINKHTFQLLLSLPLQKLLTVWLNSLSHWHMKPSCYGLLRIHGSVSARCIGGVSKFFDTPPLPKVGLVVSNITDDLFECVICYFWPEWWGCKDFSATLCGIKAGPKYSWHFPYFIMLSDCSYMFTWLVFYAINRRGWELWFWHTFKGNLSGWDFFRFVTFLTGWRHSDTPALVARC